MSPGLSPGRKSLASPRKVNTGKNDDEISEETNTVSPAVLTEIDSPARISNKRFIQNF